jgi:hypothetical protein
MTDKKGKKQKEDKTSTYSDAFEEGVLCFLGCAPRGSGDAWCQAHDLLRAAVLGVGVLDGQ